jgi:hypothetical protein
MEDRAVWKYSRVRLILVKTEALVISISRLDMDIAAVN